MLEILEEDWRRCAERCREKQVSRYKEETTPSSAEIEAAATQLDQLKKGDGADKLRAALLANNSDLRVCAVEVNHTGFYSARVVSAGPVSQYGEVHIFAKGNARFGKQTDAIRCAKALILAAQTDANLHTPKWKRMVEKHNQQAGKEYQWICKEHTFLESVGHPMSNSESVIGNHNYEKF